MLFWITTAKYLFCKLFLIDSWKQWEPITPGECDKHALEEILQLVTEGAGHTVGFNTCTHHITISARVIPRILQNYRPFLCPCMVHDATMLFEAAWHIQNVICNGIPLSSLTLGVRQVFSLDMKASGDACQSWSPMMMAWGRETASVPLTWKLFWVSALLW